MERAQRFARFAKDRLPEHVELEVVETPGARRGTKGDLNTVLTVVVVAGLTARNVAPFLSSAAELIRAWADLIRARNERITSRPVKIRLNREAFDDDERVISRVEEEVLGHAVDTDITHQRSELGYELDLWE